MSGVSVKKNSSVTKRKRQFSEKVHIFLISIDYLICAVFQMSHSLLILNTKSKDSQLNKHPVPLNSSLFKVIFVQEPHSTDFFGLFVA